MKKQTKLQKPRNETLGTSARGFFSHKNSHASSFRDPSGFVFFEGGKIFRKINPVYFENFKLLNESGLYEKLASEKLLVPHKVIAPDLVEPKMIPFISYPYEWSFSMLKDAAILTLKIQKISLEHGMILKDATSYNVQFLSGKPIFIDTLSFEKYQEGTPWVAYKQFCEQFLAPLALISYTDVRVQKLLEPFMDGVPLDLAAKLLPFKAKINTGVLMHISMHAGSQKKHADSNLDKQRKAMFSKNSLLGLVSNLENSIRSLRWKLPETAWKDYGADDYFESYGEKSLDLKKQAVSKFLDIVKPKTAWDLGANTGNYCRIAASKGVSTVGLDFDPTVVEQLYIYVREKGEENILPLWVDLANPTPAIGFRNKERDSFLSRPKPDVVMALAVIHHLAIGKNLPMPRLAEFFAELSDNLIIEFVPKEDPQTQRLLRSREDIFVDYTQKDFESEFGNFFQIVDRYSIPDSKRTLYLMRKR